MKRKLMSILLASACLLMLCACGKKEKDSDKKSKNTQDTESVAKDTTDDVTAESTDFAESNMEVVGGWTINGDLPAINDADFDQAASDYEGMSFVPILKLAAPDMGEYSMPVYLAYATPTTADATTSLKVVTLTMDLIKGKYSIMYVKDFIISDYVKDNQLPTGDDEHWHFNKETGSLLDQQTNNYFMDALAMREAPRMYHPICVLGTQVVAGTNYTILSWYDNFYVVTIYVDLEGHSTITSECAIDLFDFLNV